jgi:AcrR family transcriptional regulator
MNDRTNSHGDATRNRILKTGAKLWRSDPASVSARQIGKQLGLTHSAILYHYGSIDRLKEEIAQYAIATGDAKIIAHLIVTGNALVKDMAPETRADWLGRV